MAAPTRRRPCLSLQASGNRFIMSMSLIVIRPVSKPLPSTNSSFSTLLAIKIFSASSSVTVPVAVTRPELVMMSAMGVSPLSRNRRSRRVIMPTSRRPSVVMGTPEILYWSITSRARATVATGGRVTGSAMMPFALRLTLSTSSACRSIDRFL